MFCSFVSLCVVIHSVEFSDCCYITSYTQMINKNVLFPVDTEPVRVLLYFAVESYFDPFSMQIKQDSYLSVRSFKMIFGPLESTKAACSTGHYCHLLDMKSTTTRKHFCLQHKSVSNHRKRRRVCPAAKRMMKTLKLNWKRWCEQRRGIDVGRFLEVFNQQFPAFTQLCGWHSFDSVKYLGVFPLKHVEVDTDLVYFLLSVLIVLIR